MNASCIFDPSNKFSLEIKFPLVIHSSVLPIQILVPIRNSQFVIHNFYAKFCMDSKLQSQFVIRNS